jgi:pimeloyl-ACP methyl ester carboxylesterase
MQIASGAADGVNLDRYWAAGTAPIFEIIATLDPFHQQDQRHDLQSRLGPRATSTVIEDASHALFPEQPTAVARAVIGYLRTPT